MPKKQKIPKEPKKPKEPVFVPTKGPSKYCPLMIDRLRRSGTKLADIDFNDCRCMYWSPSTNKCDRVIKSCGAWNRQAYDEYQKTITDSMIKQGQL